MYKVTAGTNRELFVIGPEELKPLLDIIAFSENFTPREPEVSRIDIRKKVIKKIRISA